MTLNATFSKLFSYIKVSKFSDWRKPEKVHWKLKFVMTHTYVDIILLIKLQISQNI